MSDPAMGLIVLLVQGSGMVRKLPVGWWVKGAGWCPTRAVLLHTLRKIAYPKTFIGSRSKRSTQAREALRYV